MIRFNYCKENSTAREKYEFNNGWNFENSSVYRELLKIIGNDVDRIINNILVEYNNSSDLEERLKEFLEKAKKRLRYRNLWQSDSYLVFSIGSFDACNDDIDYTLIIKNNWKEFYFLTKQEENIDRLESYRLVDNVVDRRIYEEAKEFNYQDDNSINNSINTLLLSYK